MWRWGSWPETVGRSCGPTSSGRCGRRSCSSPVIAYRPMTRSASVWPTGPSPGTSSSTRRWPWPTASANFRAGPCRTRSGPSTCTSSTPWPPSSISPSPPRAKRSHCRSTGTGWRSSWNAVTEPGAPVRFSLSSEQQLLAQSADQWAHQQSDHGFTRAAVAGKAVPLGDLWGQIAELGWLGLTIPEETGGSGGSLVDACIVAEALARHLVPVPYVGNAVIAAAGLRTLGADQGLLADLAAGARRFSVVLGDDLDWPPSSDTGLAWEWTEG